MIELRVLTTIIIVCLSRWTLFNRILGSRTVLYKSNIVLTYLKLTLHQSQVHLELESGSHGTGILSPEGEASVCKYSSVPP